MEKTNNENMISSSMYLLIFKKPSELQIQIIRETFKEFDWQPGIAVEEIVADQLINDNLIIQFVSFKEFIEKDKKTKGITLYPETVEAVLTGKGQFFGSLFSNDIEDLETYFCYLGDASSERDEKNETIFKVGYGKYSSLDITNLKLEQLL